MDYTVCRPVAAVWSIYVPFGKKYVSSGSTAQQHTVSRNQLHNCTAQSRLEVLHTCNCVWFWTNQFCGCLYMTLCYTDFTGQESQGFVVEMFLIPLQYYVMFLLTEHTVISVASSSSSTGNLFKICSSVEILLVERNWNTMKPTCDFSTTLFIGFLFLLIPKIKNPSVFHCAAYLRWTAVNHVTVKGFCVTRYHTDRRKNIKKMDSTRKPRKLNLPHSSRFSNVRTKCSRW